MERLRGWCELTVTGDKLDFEDIKSNILLKPDDEVRKGEKIEDDKGFYDRDMLQYEVQFGDDIEMTDALEKLIFKLYPFRGYISEIASEYDIKLSVFIDSFSHEIFFTLPKNITKELKEFNIDFEIMLYSPR